MTRRTFSQDRLAYQISDSGDYLHAADGTQIPVYADQNCTVLADIQNLDGSPLPGSLLTVDAASQIPRFLGPDDDTVTLYVKGAAGTTAVLTAEAASRYVLLEDARLTDPRTPSGPAGGDLSGSYPNPVVARLNGVSVTGTPAVGDALVATGAANAEWGPVSTPMPWRFNIADYGAVGDAVIVTDGAVAAGVATLTCSTSQPFTAAVVGKPVLIQDAGPSGVTAFATTIAGYNGPDRVALTDAPPTAASGAIVVFGTNNYAAIRSATTAAEEHLAAGHPYAEVYTPPVGGYVIDGPLDTSKSGNGQIPFGEYATTAGKKGLAFASDGLDSAGVRHWDQLVPQISGATWISFAFYASTAAQLNDLNANGNPGVISGPNEGTSNGLAYGAGARFSNVQPIVRNMAFLLPHTQDGITCGAANFYGCANAHVVNVSVSTLGVVPNSSDYTSPATFSTGLSVGFLMPAPGNNDLSIVDNLSVQGGFTYAIFFSEHTLITRIMVLYCWSALCAVGSYAGSVGAVHAMKVLSASVEACANELYIVGVGSQGVGPTVDIDQLSTESSTPTVSGNSSTALKSALGTVKLTGLFTESGVNVTGPTGLLLVNGQVPRAVKKKTSAFTPGPLDRTLICDTTAAGFTATLPAADFNAVEYTFRNIGSNTLTLTASGGQLIFTNSSTGAATTAVGTGTTVKVQAFFDGSTWNWCVL